jgi:hypothetical protein
MIVGDKSKFAIESQITQAYARLSFRALGFFVIHIGGHIYGLRKPDATMLACSFDEVQRRILRRGSHIAPFANEPNAEKIACSFRDSVYSAAHESERFFGISRLHFSALFSSNELIWAPDGDEAFDDESYVLHFDIANRVRLIAFNCAESHYPVPHTLNDVWLEADEFYGVLEEWCKAFEAEWMATAKIPERNEVA